MSPLLTFSTFITVGINSSYQLARNALAAAKAFLAMNYVCVTVSSII